jgi:predicted component of type VI protein secretion system
MRHRSSDEKQLVASVLDRLLDDTPEQQNELPPRPAALINDVRASVCRDLRNLLNARRRLVGASDEYPELEDSGRQAEARVLSFQIEAVLVVEPMQEPVLFTTTLDVSRSEFDVKAPR